MPPLSVLLLLAVGDLQREGNARYAPDVVILRSGNERDTSGIVIANKV